MPKIKRQYSKNPIKLSTLNTCTIVELEIKTELPLEFKEDAYMIWKLTEFKDKCFDAIIGQNILKPIGAVIDLENDLIRINNNNIKFINAPPYEFDEILELECM